MKLYVGWQDELSRRWYTIGVLSSDAGDYVFSYTKGALSAQEAGRFSPLPRMTDLNKVYRSSELFPIFSNRILPKSRPEYRDYLDWMGLEEESTDSLGILARSGGGRVTDNLQVYPVPEKSPDGKYKSYFFAHGLRYMAEVVLQLIPNLEVGQRLFPMLDCNNLAHSLAVALRADDPAFLVGYCPRHMAEGIGALAKQPSSTLQITVNKVNKNAPYQMMLRCKAEAEWPEGFEPCTADEYKLLAQ